MPKPIRQTRLNNWTKDERKAESNLGNLGSYIYIASALTFKIRTLSKHDRIYSTTGFSLDDVNFGKYVCASSGDSLAISGLPKVQDVKTRKSRSVNTGYIFTILSR